MAWSLLGLLLVASILSLQLGSIESMSMSGTLSSMIGARFSFARSASGLTMTSQRPNPEKIVKNIAAVSGVTGVSVLATHWRQLLEALQTIQRQEEQQEEEIRAKEFMLRLKQQQQYQHQNTSMSVMRTGSTGGGSDSGITTHAQNNSAIAMTYLQTMTAGAVSRSMAQTLLHPAYTYKTLLQLKNVGQHIPKPSLSNLQFSRLLKGIDAQFLLSLPHGAFHFFVIDHVSVYHSLLLL